MDAGRRPKKSLAQVSAPPLRLGLLSRTANTRNHCRNCAAALPGLFRAHFVRRGCGTPKVYKLSRAGAMHRLGLLGRVTSIRCHATRMDAVSEKYGSAVGVDCLSSDRAGLVKGSTATPGCARCSPRLGATRIGASPGSTLLAGFQKMA